MLECSALRPGLSRLQRFQAWLNSGDLPWRAFASKAHLDYSREQDPRQLFLLGLYCHSTKTVREKESWQVPPGHPRPGNPAMALKTFEITGPVMHTLFSKVPLPQTTYLRILLSGWCPWSPLYFSHRKRVIGPENQNEPGHGSLCQ